MRSRLEKTLATFVLVLVTTHCGKRTAAPKTDRSANARVASSSGLPGSIPSFTTTTATESPSAAPLSSARDAPSGSGDCAQKHWENPWRPLQTAENPVQTVACGGSGCVAIERLVERGEPCPGRCRRVTITPRVARNEHVQRLLDAQITEVMDDDCWLTFLDYSVHHDENGILDVTFRMSGSGAYPSTQTAHVTIELTTGFRLRAENVFSSRTLPELTGAMRSKVLAAWRRASKDHAEVYRGRETPHFAREHLDAFIVHAGGVTFFFDYGLPHALELAMPASEFLFSKREIQRFIEPAGPLRFLRD